MSLSRYIEEAEVQGRGTRSQSAQGLATAVSSPAMKIPLPPRMWITDIEAESSDEGSVRDEGVVVERHRVRSRFRHHKTRNLSMPIGIFWDIENCQVPRGCSALDVVAAIRAKFLSGRREADFVVVCDVRKEAANRLQELNDAQVSLIHVCGTQKNAADEKLRQCMRRFGELHSAPAALLLISGDINFAADLCDFRHRKNMEVILVHKQNTSSALIACATSHYCYNQLTAALPRNPKSLSQSHSDCEEATCELEVHNLPLEQAPERVAKRLRRLADNCGGKVLRVNLPTATIRFPTPDHAARALKRMDGEDVFGRKISTRFARGACAPAYSSDEGYNSTAPAAPPPPPQQACSGSASANEWAMALQQLPAPTPPPHDFCPPPAPKPRKIRGTHGSVNLDRSGCSSSNSGDDGRHRAASPWNSSASFSEHSDGEDTSAELTVANLPPLEPNVLQDMLTKLFSQYVPVVRVSVWTAGEGPLATVLLRSEWDARLCIARVHKRRLDHHFAGRRLELSLGRPSPAPNLDVLRARLRAILLDQKHHMLPLLRLRDAYASRHCCALTTSDLSKIKDTVIIHDGFGRMVQLIDLNPVTASEMEEAPWKCQLHASGNTGQEDGSRILQLVYMEIGVLAQNVKILLENHGGILPLLSFVECYEATFGPLCADARGVPLELLLRGVPGVQVRDSPSRHLAFVEGADSAATGNGAQSESSRSSGGRQRARTAPVLEPMLALFERELVDLLRTAPRCTIPFSKLIPAFHHHFGRQCRVADYGFTKLPDLLAALGNTIVVLGSGSSRIITLSSAAQARRWTSDLVKIVKAAPGCAVHINELPNKYQEMFGRALSPVEYGLCTLEELMSRVPATSVARAGPLLAAPRRAPTPDERTRTLHFAAQTVELLSHTPNLRVEFPRFVPSYHAHFGRQLRVGQYGCARLADLLELVPDVSICVRGGGERSVQLVPGRARPILAQRLRALGSHPLDAFPALYAAHYGAKPQLDMLDATSYEQLIYLAGGSVEGGCVVPPGADGRWAGACLAACAALCDRSVGRDATIDHFAASYRRLVQDAPDLQHLAAAAVVIVEGSRVRLGAAWRVVWRLARLLSDAPGALSLPELYAEYSNRYEPIFPGTENGMNGAQEYLRQYGEIFSEAGGRFSLRPGVAVPRVRAALPHEDYSLHDTPPGQKGSRVFESPKHNIWCSPPASALPAPCALLSQERRRTRLAAQFDAAL